MSAERIRRLTAFLAREPDDPFTRYALALEHAGEGDTARAVELLTDLRRRNPSFVATYQLLGQLYVDEGNVPRAREVLSEGITRARTAGEQHLAGEMQEALDDLPE